MYDAAGAIISRRDVLKQDCPPRTSRSTRMTSRACSVLATGGTTISVWMLLLLVQGIHIGCIGIKGSTTENDTLFLRDTTVYTVCWHTHNAPT